MKILVSTDQTQGQHPGDFCRCIPGELVMPPPLVCDADLADPDIGGCGCGRSWCGANSHQGTTSAVVRELDVTGSGYTEAIASALDAMGWGRDGARRDAGSLAALAAAYPPGTVLGHRLGEVHVRAVADEDRMSR